MGICFRGPLKQRFVRACLSGWSYKPGAAGCYPAIPPAFSLLLSSANDDDKKLYSDSMMMDTMMTCDAGPSRPRGVATVVSAPLIENLDRFGVQELERMRERQMKIVNRP